MQHVEEMLCQFVICLDEYLIKVKGPIIISADVPAVEEEFPIQTCWSREALNIYMKRI